MISHIADAVFPGISIFGRYLAIPVGFITFK